MRPWHLQDVFSPNQSGFRGRNPKSLAGERPRVALDMIRNVVSRTILFEGPTASGDVLSHYLDQYSNSRVAIRKDGAGNPTLGSCAVLHNVSESPGFLSCLSS